MNTTPDMDYTEFLIQLDGALINKARESIVTRAEGERDATIRASLQAFYDLTGVLYTYNEAGELVVKEENAEKKALWEQALALQVEAGGFDDKTNFEEIVGTLSPASNLEEAESSNPKLAQEIETFERLVFAHRMMDEFNRSKTAPKEEAQPEPDVALPDMSGYAVNLDTVATESNAVSDRLFKAMLANGVMLSGNRKPIKNAKFNDFPIGYNDDKRKQIQLDREQAIQVNEATVTAALENENWGQACAMQAAIAHGKGDEKLATVWTKAAEAPDVTARRAALDAVVALNPVKIQPKNMEFRTAYAQEHDMDGTKIWMLPENSYRYDITAKDAKTFQQRKLAETVLSQYEKGRDAFGMIKTETEKQAQQAGTKAQATRDATSAAIQAARQGIVDERAKEESQALSKKTVTFRRTITTPKAHKYKDEKVYSHATRVLKRRKYATDTMMANVTALEKEHGLPGGIKDGKLDSNAIVYLYKLNQVRLLTNSDTYLILRDEKGQRVGRTTVEERFKGKTADGKPGDGLTPDELEKALRTPNFGGKDPKKVMEGLALVDTMVDERGHFLQEVPRTKHDLSYQPKNKVTFEMIGGKEQDEFYEIEMKLLTQEKKAELEKDGYVLVDDKGKPADGKGKDGDTPAPAPDGKDKGGDIPAPAPDGKGKGGDTPAPAPDGKGKDGDIPAPAPDGKGKDGDTPAPAPENATGNNTLRQHSGGNLTNETSENAATTKKKEEVRS